MNRPQANGIDMMQIAGILLRHFWIIVFSGVLVGMGALIFTKLTTTPTYTSSTKMYVLSRGQSASDVTSSDLQLSAVLASDYAQLIKDRTVTESVIAELGLSMNSAALASKISVDMPGQGRIITISVTDTDPYMAAKLATTVRDTAATHIKEVMDSEAVNVVEEANIPEGQTMFNYKKNGLAGIVLGMAVAIGIIMLQYMMNDTIKNADDGERYLGLSLLGSIPIMENERRKKKRKK